MRLRSTLALLLNARMDHPRNRWTAPNPGRVRADTRLICWRVWNWGAYEGRRSCSVIRGGRASAVAVRRQRPKDGWHQPDRAAMSTRATLAHLICCDHRKCRVRSGLLRTVSSRHHPEARSARHPGDGLAGRWADTARQSVDSVDTNQPLSWAFHDAMAPCLTRWTARLGFTHQRSAIRYRPRPPVSIEVEDLLR